MSELVLKFTVYFSVAGSYFFWRRMGALESMPEEDIVEQFNEGPTMFENW